MSIAYHDTTPRYSPLQSFQRLMLALVAFVLFVAVGQAVRLAVDPAIQTPQQQSDPTTIEIET